MILLCYSIFDTATQAYNTPWFMTRRQEAERAFRELVNDRNVQIGRTPEDYILFEVGEFDTSTGVLAEHTKPEKLGRGNEFVVDQAKVDQFCDAMEKTLGTEEVPSILKEQAS